MRETLYIRLRGPDADAPLAHALVIDTGTAAPPSIVVQRRPLAELLELAAGRRVVAFVPAAEVRLTEITVPARQPAKALQAAPFVLEDQFADDVETLHFAIGERRANGAFPIAAIAHARVAAWLAPFAAAGVPLTALVPEILALPWPDSGAWPVLAEAEETLCRSGYSAGFACAPEDFESFLALSGALETQALQVHLPRGVADDFSRLPQPVELRPGFEDGLEALIRGWRPAASINLLQGRYSQREALNRYWQPWRLAAGLAAVAFLLGVAVNGVQALRYEHQAAAQVAANEAQFRQLFPRESRIVDLQVQLDQQLRALRGNSGGNLFLLMQEAAAGLAGSPGLKLKGAQYRDGALFLDLGSNDLQAAEPLRGYFGTHRVASFAVLDTRTGDGGAQIRVQLKAAT